MMGFFSGRWTRSRVGPLIGVSGLRSLVAVACCCQWLAPYPVNHLDLTRQMLRKSEQNQEMQYFLIAEFGMRRGEIVPALPEKFYFTDTAIAG